MVIMSVGGTKACSRILSDEWLRPLQHVPALIRPRNGIESYNMGKGLHKLMCAHCGMYIRA